jgi:hypothetical protein
MALRNKAVESARIKLISCLGVEGELPLLPHFLRHYRGLGIDPANMHVILNTEDAGSSRLGEAEDILRRFGAPPPRRWIAPYTSGDMWAERRRLQRDVAGPADFIVNADMDEFHAYPAPIGEVAAYLEKKGLNAVHGPFIDRLAKGGALAEVAASPPLSQQFPIEADVCCTLGGTGRHHDLDGTIKLMLHKASVLPSRGGHNVGGEGDAPRLLYGGRLATFPQAASARFRFALPFLVHHYKWTASLVPGLEKRLATKGVSPAGAEYGATLLSQLEESGALPLGALPRRHGSSGLLPWRQKALALRLAAAARQKRGRVLKAIPGAAAAR